MTEKQPIYKRWWFWFIIVIIIIIVACGSSSNDNNTQTTSTTDSTSISSVLNGELLDFNESILDDKKICVIKAKIEPSYSNNATINQNYYNVENFIKKQNGNLYDEISYWAVAEMTSGEESKVISFTIEKNIISEIYNDKIAINMLGDYLTDLWILPSLKN